MNIYTYTYEPHDHPHVRNIDPFQLTVIGHANDYTVIDRFDNRLFVVYDAITPLMPPVPISIGSMVRYAPANGMQKKQAGARRITSSLPPMLMTTTLDRWAGSWWRAEKLSTFYLYNR